MSRQTYSSAPASVKVRQSKQRTKAFASALIGRDLGYPEAMKVKRDLAALGVLPNSSRMLPGEPLREMSLAAKARAAGFAPHIVWNRLDHGWTEERALSTPVGATRRALSDKAHAVGLPPDMVRRRMREGMSEEQALTTPVSERHRTKRPGDIAAKARVAGLRPDTVRCRLRSGWSEDQAFSTPSQRRA